MSDNVEEMVDEQVLRQLLDQSEDFEYRRRIRARLRQLKRDDATPASSQTEKATNLDAPRYQRTATPVDRPKPSRPPVESNGKIENGQREFIAKSSNLRSVKPDDVNRPSSSISGGLQLESVSLRSAPRTAECPRPLSTPSAGSKLEPIALRKVVQSPKQAKDNIPKTRTNAPTTKAAFERFKEMDLLDASEGGKAARRRSPSPSSIKDQMLMWCRARVSCYDIELEDFSASWNDGMAFCALVHSFYPEAFDYDELNPKDKRKNFQLAFDTAEKLGDVFPLLDVDDMVRTNNPDWKCIFTYVNSIANRMAEIRKERKEAELKQQREKEEREKVQNGADD